MSKTAIAPHRQYRPRKRLPLAPQAFIDAASVPNDATVHCPGEGCGYTGNRRGYLNHVRTIHEATVVAMLATKGEKHQRKAPGKADKIPVISEKIETDELLSAMLRGLYNGRNIPAAHIKPILTLRDAVDSFLRATQ